MSEKETHVSVSVNRSYVDGQANVRITTAVTETSEAEYRERSFEDIRKALEYRKASASTAIYAAATAATGVLAINEAFQAIEDNPDRPMHAALAIFAGLTAKSFADKFRRARKAAEISGLEAKAFQNAMRTTEGEHQSHFPMNLRDRFLTAMKSYHADGINPTSDEISKRDIELRSTNPGGSRMVTEGALLETLEGLEEEGVIVAERKLVPSDNPNTKEPISRYEYHIPQQEEPQA